MIGLVHSVLTADDSSSKMGGRNASRRVRKRSTTSRGTTCDTPLPPGWWCAVRLFVQSQSCSVTPRWRWRCVTRTCRRRFCQQKQACSIHRSHRRPTSRRRPQRRRTRHTRVSRRAGVTRSREARESEKGKKRGKAKVSRASRNQNYRSLFVSFLSDG